MIPTFGGLELRFGWRIFIVLQNVFVRQEWWVIGDFHNEGKEEGGREVFKERLC
jgi:hypothetical protein